MSAYFQICCGVTSGFPSLSLDDVTTSYDDPPWQLVCCFLQQSATDGQGAEGVEAWGPLMDTLGFEDPLNLQTKSFAPHSQNHHQCWFQWKIQQRPPRLPVISLDSASWFKWVCLRKKKHCTYDYISLCIYLYIYHITYIYIYTQ